MTVVYIRHRDRMVQESVFEDLVNTLIACRWMPGTTTRPVRDPYEPTAGFQTVTTAPDQVLAMLTTPITMTDYYSELSDPDENTVGEPETGHTAPNTMALDDGQAGEAVPMELGSTATEVPYRFTLAISAESVGVAQALLNDLRDRYLGRIVNGEVIDLYDYNTDPTTPVARLDVDDFQYLRDDEVKEVIVFYGQLLITDYVD